MATLYYSDEQMSIGQTVREVTHIFPHLAGLDCFFVKFKVGEGPYLH